MEKDLPKRKSNRLENYDYSSCGAYFITICTRNRRCMLSRVVGTGVLDGPFNELLLYGKIADKYINMLNEFYERISVESYVIMPNHIHMLLFVKSNENGPSGTPVPTVQNSTVSRFISTFKRFCNKEYGENIWQKSFHDHVIRNRQDWEEHVKYIHENPFCWSSDEFYTEE